MTELKKYQVVSYFQRSKIIYAEVFMAEADYENFKEEWDDIVNSLERGIITIEPVWVEVSE